ncbi:MAG: type IX secretion system membrane protein PorP/SprF [Flavobacteriales bacterium]|nr:type IX secretion system membrane protein PorP/SprF [Flavobacteriales bacterium]
MKNLYISSLLILVMSLAMTSAAQQLFRRTQFPINSYLVNPAVAGTQSYSPIYASYRNQWAGFKGAPVTYSVSGHTGLNHNIGVGGVVYSDKTGGAISRTGAELTGSYSIDLNNYDAVSFGLSAMVSQFSFDNSKLVVYDQNDLALNGFQAENHMNFDANFGFLVYGAQYYFGFSVPQLIQTKLGLESLVDPGDNRNARHFLMMGAYKYYLNDEWDIQGSGLVKFTAVTPVQIDVNVQVNYLDRVWGGFTVRPKDAIAILLGGQYMSFTLNYSYDLTTSNASSFSPHTHELTIGYLIPRRDARFVNKSLLGPRILDKSRIRK